MAGIGFTLKKMFQKETFSNRALAYLYSSFIAAGPWIISVISINALLMIMQILDVIAIERNLFSATIVYTFLFSQLLISPIQLLITRYLSDQLYEKKYEMIRPTFIGINKIVFFLSLIICTIFYWNKPIPIYYKIFSSYLFIVLSTIWILMIFLSAIKNYKLIIKAYLFGALVTIGLLFYLIENPIYFNEYQSATNFLIAYLLGLTTTLVFFLYSFFSTFEQRSIYEFDFIRYFNKHFSLCLIGIFYTAGLWIDNLIMWFSKFELTILDTFRFAPYYDNAIFLSYLTTIPALVLFLVLIETDFYLTYKQYFANANSPVTLKEIKKSENKMKKTLSDNLFFTFFTQLLISVTIVLLSTQIFNFLSINYMIRDIFKITTIGTLFNIMSFLLILIFLYFERKGNALFVAFSFFILNGIFTLIFKFLPIEYTGLGFTLASFISFMIASYILKKILKEITYTTFALQPIYIAEEKGIFVSISKFFNAYLFKKDMQKQNYKKATKK